MKNLNTNKKLDIKQVSYGQWKMTTTRYNKDVSLITNDSELIDKIKDGSNAAKLQAIKKIRLNAFLTF